MFARLTFGSSLGALALCLAAPAMAQEAAPAPAPAKPAKPPTAAKRPPAEPIVVTGTRADVNARADRLSFDVSKDLHVQAGTLAEALRAVPGVEVDLEGKVSLRGDSGVKILVDGRESAMFTGEGRSTAIVSMPAGQIERVEVIHNPSAAMSPEGSGGVINLIMKRARPDTRYATVRGNIGGAKRHSLGLNAVNSTGKLTATGDLNYRRFNADSSVVQDRTPLVSGPTTRREAQSDFLSTGGNGRIALEYDVDKKNRVTAEVSLFRFDNDVDSEEQFTSNVVTAGFDRTTRNDILNKGANGRATYRRTLPGKEHEIVAEAMMIKGNFRRDVEAVLTPAAAPVSAERFRNEGEWNHKILKAEYKGPMGKEDSINLGYQGNFARNAFEFFGARGPTFDTLVTLPAFTNEFAYDEAIHAVFATYNFKVGAIEAMTGLRLEQVEMDIDQVTDGLRFENDYFRAYPTLHLSTNLNDTQKLRASYSRRIQRPQPQDLNPYTIYSDPLNLRRGNPFLKPQVTDSFELSWQVRKGSGFYSLTGFYRNSKDGVTDIFTDLGGGVILASRDNLSTARSVGVEAVANGKITKTLTYNASATLGWNEIDPRTGGFTQKSSGTTGSLRGTANWQPTANDFFQLNGQWNGRQLLPQGYRDPGGTLNLGYRRKVNDKLSLLLTGQNVLDSQRNTVVYTTSTIRERAKLRGPGPAIFVGATYTFGNTNGKPRKDPGFDFTPGGGETPQ